MFSLRARIIAGLLAVAAYGLLALGVALSLPQGSLTFQQDGERLRADDGQGGVFTVVAFDVGGDRLPADPLLAVEEPDVLPDYAAMEALFQNHQRLYQALRDGRLVALGDGGQRLPVTPLERGLTDLPGLFWLQLLCGLAGMVICLLVWIPGQREVAIHAFALTGLSYVLFSSAAAIYSTRALFIPGDLFALLSGLNHVGALLFSASLGAFLWNYPRRAPSARVAGAFYGAFLVAIVIDQGRLTASPVTGFHLWVMGIFLIGLAGAGWQWWRTRGRPLERAALRWVVISIVAGTAFFAGGMILPAIKQSAQASSQGLLFTTFLLMYAGMALGVVRYRLFDLERWWFSLWAWLLGGIVVMLTDLVLASLLSLSGPATLSLSLALVGWCYFPLRQYVWGRLFARREPGLDAWLARALPAMLRARHERLDDSGVEDALRAVFRPLSLESETAQKGSPAAAELADNGAALRVPDPAGDRVHVLRHPQEGARLFTRQDVDIAGLVLSLHELVNRSQTARAEGASEERNRIRQDIHDDLGAKLLHLLHAGAEEYRPLVRDAIRDLRDLLQNMEGRAVRLDAAAAQWREETGRRCEDHGVELHWHQVLPAVTLDADQYSELTRIVREAVSNALRHARASTLEVSLTSEQEGIVIVIVNDGLADSGDGAVGRGLMIMANRARKLGGECQYGSEGDRWRVRLHAPLVRYSA
ncbi:sensor histidine kinase [Alloalcanivorax sp. C16-1]|uniref:sensor histidine kinase n=1 Tax=Alloalcanivorax sp. C16-1 TaxID=3390051 RepID=UPI0039711329